MIKKIALATMLVMALAIPATDVAQAGTHWEGAGPRPRVTEPCSFTGNKFDGYAGGASNLGGIKADIQSTGEIYLCATADDTGVAVWVMLDQGYCCTAPFGYTQVGYLEHIYGFDGPTVFTQFSSQTHQAQFLTTFYLSYNVAASTHNYDMRVISSGGHLYAQPMLDGSVIDALALDWTTLPPLAQEMEETLNDAQYWQTALFNTIQFCQIASGASSCTPNRAVSVGTANAGAPANANACYLWLAQSKFEVYDKRLLGYCM